MGYPKAPKSLAEHMKKRRLDLGLLQQDFAKQIGVNPWIVGNWEKGNTKPVVHLIPHILRFLEYDPEGY